MSAFRNARMAMRGMRILAAGLTLALGTIEVRGDQIFTLSGVTFDDGGTATGTFTTNDALSALLDFDITTSGGTGSGFHYTSATADSSSTALPFILVLNTPPALDHILELTFTNLTAAGSPITLGENSSFEQTPPGGVKRVVVSGQVVGISAVPEPSSMAMGGIAAVAAISMTLLRRRASSESR